MSQSTEINADTTLVDWLDGFFDDWNLLTDDQREESRKRFARGAADLFDRRAQGLLSFPDLRPKKKT